MNQKNLFNNYYFIHTFHHNINNMLRTMETIGYLIADVDQNASDEIKSQIDMLPSTIKTRILY